MNARSRARRLHHRGRHRQTPSPGVHAGRLHEMKSRSSARAWRSAAISSIGLNQPASSRAMASESRPLPRQARCSAPQHALAAVLADADELQRGGANGGERLVKVGGQRGGERDAADARLQRADDEMMPASRGRAAIAAANSASSGAIADRAQRREPPAAELSAGRARFAGQLPGVDLPVDRAPFLHGRAPRGRSADTAAPARAARGRSACSRNSRERRFVAHARQAARSPQTRANARRRRSETARPPSAAATAASEIAVSSRCHVSADVRR